MAGSHLLRQLAAVPQEDQYIPGLIIRPRRPHAAVPATTVAAAAPATTVAAAAFVPAATFAAIATVPAATAAMVLAATPPVTPPATPPATVPAATPLATVAMVLAATVPATTRPAIAPPAATVPATGPATPRRTAISATAAPPATALAIARPVVVVARAAPATACPPAVRLLVPVWVTDHQAEVLLHAVLSILTHLPDVDPPHVAIILLYSDGAMRSRVEDLLDLERIPLWEVSFGICFRKGATCRRRCAIIEGLHP